MVDEQGSYLRQFAFPARSSLRLSSPILFICVHLWNLNYRMLSIISTLVWSRKLIMILWHNVCMAL